MESIQERERKYSYESIQESEKKEPSHIVQLVSHDNQLFALTNYGVVLHLVGKTSVDQNGQLTEKFQWETLPFNERQPLIKN